MRLPPGLSPLRHRDFTLYWVGQVVSQTGSLVEMTATTYLLYAITNSPVLLGIGGLTRAVPILAFALFGGALADRIDRKRLLLFLNATQAVTSLILGTLVATGAIEYWHIYVLGFVNSSLAAFEAPARNSYYPSLIPRSEFQNAVTLSATIFRLSSLIGPAVAGVLIAPVSTSSPFFLNPPTHFGLIFALLAIRTQPVRATGPQPSLRSSVWGGLQYAMRNPVLPLILSTEAVLSIFGHNAALITIFARDILHVGPDGLGLLLSAIGGGAILRALGLVALGEIPAKGAPMISAGVASAGPPFALAFSTSFCPRLRL